MTWSKVFVLDEVVDWGFNLVVSDVDVVWFKDPLPLFAQHPHAGGHPCSSWLPAADAVCLANSSRVLVRTACSASPLPCGPVPVPSRRACLPERQLVQLPPACLPASLPCLQTLFSARMACPPATSQGTRGWRAAHRRTLTSTQVGAQAVGASSLRGRAMLCCALLCRAFLMWFTAP